MPLYPRVHLLPSGDIICTSPIREKTMSFIPEVGPYGGVFTPVCNCPPPDDYPGYGWGSVLLPLSYRNNYRASVLMCGGASEVAYRLDLKDWSPSTAILNLWAWRPTSPRAMRERRLHANATLLPTGEVLVTGGIDAGALDLTTPDARGVREPEIYDPYADKWSVPKEPASEVRNYHSVALLMPDGRVWTAGSDHNAGGGLGARNLNTEIFAPWYYGDPDRPYIKAAPSLAYPNETIYVESTHAKEIERVVLLRCGSCTHAFNPDQRLLELEFKHPTGDALLVKLPPDNFILPPGPYFIYTIRRKSGTLGLPSYGTDIYIVPERTPKDPPSEPGGH